MSDQQTQIKVSGKPLFKLGIFSITWKELITAVLLGMLGFFITTSKYINFLNGLNPPYGYFLNLIGFYVIILVASYLGLTFIGFKLDKWYNAFGLFFITYAILLVTSLNSPYANLKLYDSVNGISQIYFQSADGAVWYLWDKIFNKVWLLRILTYIFTPFVLTLFGAFFVKKQVTL